MSAWCSIILWTFCTDIQQYRCFGALTTDTPFPRAPLGLPLCSAPWVHCPRSTRSVRSGSIGRREGPPALPKLSLPAHPTCRNASLLKLPCFHSPSFRVYVFHALPVLTNEELGRCTCYTTASSKLDQAGHSSVQFRS